ncbi:hypothetical protein [Bradyrhizobium embrapense]|uniref:hypothetical protein n=1 Tax=Bradyrhizobium embrapense TaxID=630921 RepID=UPI000A976877|nr:hypothetical protein [Bradyrhizobium embrapense]
MSAEADEAEDVQACILPPASQGGRPLPQNVRVFLVDSERRVVLHCQKLLAQDDLPGELRQRLLRLAAAAEDQMQRLAGAHEIKAA